MFYIIDKIYNKVKTWKRDNRNKPDRIIYILIWLTLIFLITFVFYNLGTFNYSKKDVIKKTLGSKNNFNLDYDNLIDKFTNKPKPLNNFINEFNFD